jgi:hypothetical protein
MDLAGVYVWIVSGTGAGQVRRISGSAGKELYLDEPWDVTPDSTSYFEIGRIQARWRGKYSNLGLPGKIKTLKFLNVDTRPERISSSPRVKIYREFVDVDYFDASGVPSPHLRTASKGRSQAGLMDASAYNLAVEINADGAEAPFAFRGMSASVAAKEED